MKLEELLKQALLPPYGPLSTSGRHVEQTDGGTGFDVIADCRSDDQALLLAHCATQLPKTVEALRSLLRQPDTLLVKHGHWECQWCRREWSAACGDDEVPELCPDEDCPGHRARAILKEAEEVKES